MSVLDHFHHPVPLQSVTVRELERHGVDRLGPRFAGLVFLGPVSLCAACTPVRLAAVLEGRPETERAEVLYGDATPSTTGLTTRMCTGHPA